MWMKWRHKFSNAPGDWEWRNLGSFPSGSNPKHYVEDLLPELSREFEYSEHYRGIDYELSEMPPIDVLKSYIADARSAVKYAKQNLKILENMLLTAQGVK